MTSPAVVEKVSVDIDLNGGLDESKPEEAIDWTKSFSEVQNLVSNGGQYVVRKGATSLATTDSDAVSLAPVHRLAALDGGLGVVGASYQLYHLNEATQALINKGRMPEFGVQRKAAGSSTDVTTISGVVGVAITTNYHVIAYQGEQADSSTLSVLLIDVIDKNSNNVIKSYYYTSTTGSRRWTMVGVSDRYLHIFESDGTGATKPRLFAIDTNSLPSASLLVPSWTEFTSSAVGDKVMGVVATASNSVAIITGPATNRIEKFSVAAASVTSAALTGYTNVTGLDTDGTNFYVAGRLLGFSDPGVGLSLDGWFKPTFSASPWVTSEGGLDLAEPTNPPSAATAVNGLVGARFDATNDRLVNASLGSYMQNASGTMIFLVNVASTSSTSIMKVTGGAGGNISLVYTATTGFVFTFKDGSTKTLNFPFPTARWAMVTIRWDSTNMSMKVNSHDWKTTAAGANVGITVGGIEIGNIGACDILEIINKKGALTNANVDEIREYFVTKYALTL